MFMKSFLAEIGKPYTEVPYRVIREAPTNYIQSFNKRIDITIDFGSHGFGIENKPWAIEQDKQLEHYHEHLDKQFGGKTLFFFDKRWERAGEFKSRTTASLS